MAATRLVSKDGWYGLTSSCTSHIVVDEHDEGDGIDVADSQVLAIGAIT